MSKALLAIPLLALGIAVVGVTMHGRRSSDRSVEPRRTPASEAPRPSIPPAAAPDKESTLKPSAGAMPGSAGAIPERADAGRELDDFWKRLDDLTRTRPELGDERFRALFLQRTGDFLGFDDARREQLSAVAAVMLRELDRARDEMRSSLRTRVLNGDGRPVPQATLKDLQQHYADSRRRAALMLQPLLDASPRQQAFSGQLDSWAYQLQGFPMPSWAKPK